VSSDRSEQQRGILNEEWIPRGKRPDEFKSRRPDYIEVALQPRCVGVGLRYFTSSMSLSTQLLS
jgi:hypothetical protein